MFDMLLFDLSLLIWHYYYTTLLIICPPQQICQTLPSIVHKPTSKLTQGCESYKFKYRVKTTPNSQLIDPQFSINISEPIPVFTFHPPVFLPKDRKTDPSLMSHKVFKQQALIVHRTTGEREIIGRYRGA